MKKSLVALAAVAACGAAVGAGFGPANYAQDGLIAQFDVIDNVRTGTFDPTATVWKDLKGSASLTVPAGVNWTADGRGIDNHAIALTISSMPSFALDSASTEATLNVISNGSRNASAAYPRVFYHTGGDGVYSVYFTTANKTAEVYMNNSGTRPSFGTFRVGTLALVTDSTNCRTYNNGVAAGKSGSCLAAGVTAAAKDWKLCGQSGFMHGVYHSLRHYNRALTAAEAARNALIDRIRFYSYVWKGAASGGAWSAAANWAAPYGGSAEGPQPNEPVRICGAAVTADAVALPTIMSLEDGASLVLAEGAAVRTQRLFVECEEIAAGVYTGSGSRGTIVSWISGAGRVVVGDVAENTASWTGAGADTKVTTVQNWSDAEVSHMDGSYLVTFATGGTAALLDTDVSWAGLVLDAATFAFSDSSHKMLLGTRGLVAKDASSARTFTVNAPVSLANSQTWRIGTNATVTLGKTLTGSGASALTVAGAGTLKLSAANVLPGVTTIAGDSKDKRLGVQVANPDGLGGAEGSTTVNQMTTALSFTQPGTVTREISVFCPQNDQDRDVYGPSTGTLRFANTYKTTQSNSRFGVYRGTTVIFDKPLSTVSAFYLSTLGSGSQPARVIFNGRLGIGDRWQVPGGMIVELNATTNKINGNSGSLYGTIQCNVPYALWKTNNGKSDGKATAVYPYSGVLNLNGYDQAVGLLTAKGQTTAGSVTSATPAVLHLVDDYMIDSYDSWVYAADGKTKVSVPGITNRVAFTGMASLSKEGKYETCLYVTSSTTGSLAVAKGTLTMAPVASWRNARNVYVRGGVLSVKKRTAAQGDAFGKKVTDVEITDGKVDIAEGETVMCHAVTLGGKTYDVFGYTFGSSESNAEIKDDVHFAGKGVLKTYGEGPGLTIYLK